ncbi:hypothetical protein [Clostridium tagluense]|uniref:Uncharacterized protein n=1 Tax=Clostridium tagluense TaxID=360422 RepID=A0A401UJP3_9CLOT|nr:hypothetical protein [Clostridium tagluense]GCD09748.1 hypothetical protein Ctaglu_13710 [Clostridium tagluense]
MLSKKNEGSIGTISIDTGADLNVQVMGRLSYDKIAQKLGTYDFTHAKAAIFNITSDFDKLKSLVKDETITITYNNKFYNFHVEMK